MKIEILHLLEGASKARGLTVIIDVFRAFSVECYLYANHAERVIPVGSVEDAFLCAEKMKNAVLVGERNGIKVEGFDYGNSPSEIIRHDFTGKTVIHTTSAGVQGLVHAEHADELLTGALVNAGAIASYIRKRNPEQVSLVCMGWNGKRDTEEDVLCAKYIHSLLVNRPLEDIARLADDLRYTEGKKFFDPLQKEVFPEEDFYLSVKHDIFDGVIRVLKDNDGYTTEWIKTDSFR